MQRPRGRLEFGECEGISRQRGQGRVNDGEKDTADGESQEGGDPIGFVGHGEMDFSLDGTGKPFESHLSAKASPTSCFN